eukprot:TRINITY_DN8262_c0_g1_i1.p1 TRINITY_DN8262_c0_g1~~TRINITY_DN8262_c0_g1_i1.p1  ORF type:complete len:676 (+),score=76.90 TRINITY_DN8262_c0_g1_i1:37-2064(+)
MQTNISDVEQMCDFQLWLHPLHGTAQRGLRPLRLEEMQNAESIAERSALLSEAASAGVDQLHADLVDWVEVWCNDLGLYALNRLAERCLWLPLALSHIIECPAIEDDSTEPSKVVGVLAYGFPSESPAISWGDACASFVSGGDFAASDVWLLLVTRRGVDGSVPMVRNADEARFVLDAAAEALGTRGALRQNMSAFESIHQTLGEGSFATVQLMQRKRRRNHAHLRAEGSSSGSSNDPPHAGRIASSFAAKQIVATASEEEVLVEMSYFLAVQGHPNIARFVGLFYEVRAENPVWTMIMEAHPRGNLKNAVADVVRFSERGAMKVSEDLLHALVHVHDLGIIHRDIKPENVLLANDDRAVLVDFGVSVHVSETARMTVRCGSPGSIAPEILRKYRYGPKSDIFSCGTVLYYALGGIMPFIGSDLLSTLRSNARARVRFPADHFEHVTLGSQDIVRLLLHLQPPRRPDARSALGAVVAASASATGIVLPGVATIAEDADAAPSDHVEEDPAPAPALPASSIMQEDVAREDATPSASSSHAREDLIPNVPPLLWPHTLAEGDDKDCSDDAVGQETSLGSSCGSPSFCRFSQESHAVGEFPSEGSATRGASKDKSNTLSRAYDYVKRVFERGPDEANFSDLRSTTSTTPRASQRRPSRLVSWKSLYSGNSLQAFKDDS